MVSISNPFDVFKAATALNSKKNFIYSKFLTNELVNKILYNKSSVDKKIKKENIGIDFEALKKCNTTFEFDKEFTFKLVKENDSKEYYKTFSCHEDLENVDVPVLFIQSRNDPISTFFKKN